jgi:transcription elongation factor GreA
MSETHLSRAAYDRLSAELEDLTTRGRVEIARAIQAARELGDLSENADYHAAKDTQGKMEARVRQLQQLLKTAVVVEAADVDTVHVAPGTVVSIRYEGDDDVERYMVGSIEEKPDDMELITPGSKLGEAILGHKIGDVVEYETPTGAKLKVEIVAVGA